MSAEALLFLRLWLGALFLAHALQKVLGWWEGPGWSGWNETVARHGFRPARPFAALAAGSELVGGPLLIAGLLTDVAAAFLSVLMVAAIQKVHWRNGFFNQKRGFEFQASLLVGLVAVGLGGPGALALDGVLDRQGGPLVYAAVALAGLLVTLPGLFHTSAAAPHAHPTPTTTPR